MIRPSAALAALEAREAQIVYASLSYEDALARFTALWCYAREIDPEIGTN